MKNVVSLRDYPLLFITVSALQDIVNSAKRPQQNQSTLFVELHGKSIRSSHVGHLQTGHYHVLQYQYLLLLL